MRLLDVDELIEIFKEEIEYQEEHISFRYEVEGLKYALDLTERFAKDNEKRINTGGQNE